MAAGRHTKGDELKKTVRVRRDACGNNASDPRQIMLTDLARSGQQRVLINVAVTGHNLKICYIRTCPKHLR